MEQEKRMTEDQRGRAIGIIIENDIEGLTKYRDMHYLLYEGCLPYKEMEDEEIIEWFEERDMEIPN